MKHSNFISFILVFVMLFAAAAGCSAPLESDTAPSTEPGNVIESATKPKEITEPTTVPENTLITVTDMVGREIILDKPASRVVALTASDCEILYAIGVGDTLVGRGEYCDYPADVINLPAVQSGNETNIEQIIALKPQVLFMNKMAQTEEQLAALENAGIKVVVCNANNIAEVYTSIELIGALMGREEEASSVINGMKASFADISANASKNAGKTVYFEVSPLEYGLWTAGTETFMNEVATMLGLTNIFADISGWGEISEEQVIKRNPDYIVSVTMYFGEGPTPEEEIKSRAGWENVTAVKNNAILNLRNNELSRPGPRIADGAVKLCELVEK